MYNKHSHEQVLSAFDMLFDVTGKRITIKAYHNDDGIQQKRNRVDQRYEHALGIKVLEIGKGPAKKMPRRCSLLRYS